MAMIGVGFCTRDKEGRFPATVAAMAKCSCLAIRALQPRGPYHLVGYSFGGLVALEVARLLREIGEEIAFLGMVDTRYDSRFWPTAIFLKSQARLIALHFAGLLHLSPSAAIRMLSYRARNFASRLLRRQIAPSSLSTASKAAPASVDQHCLMAMNNYRPRYYDGKVTLLVAKNDNAVPEFGCDPIEL